MDSTNPEDPKVGEGNGDSSERADLLAKLREMHKEAKAEHHLDVDIPGYHGLVWARFKPFPVEKTESKMNEFARLKGQPMLFKAACDTLVDACDEILLLPEKFEGVIGEDGENLISIDPDAVPPIRFDSRLEEIFNLDNPSKQARGVVSAMFPTEQAVLAMHVRVSQWMADVTSEANEILLGN